ncbi:RrF2 family transcriptional regulator [Hydrogenophaga luteola]|uniref:RrF2 family transcriptional regulator n=1 Tax=Hydrogenophaga luteola TaxID=1591122 RepID=A0ABV7W9R7_9BURK
MRLTQWTDYSLRVLMYCAACEGRALPPTVSEIAEAHGISRSHLTKIVMILAGRGWLATTRGRGGGLRLMADPRQLTLGQVIRETEPDLNLVECFDGMSNTCRLDGYCRLKGALSQAMSAFLAALDGVTLADLLAPSPRIAGLAGQLPHLIPIQMAPLKRAAGKTPSRKTVRRPA